MGEEGIQNYVEGKPRGELCGGKQDKKGHQKQ
jgi:hypothetical protein